MRDKLSKLFEEAAAQYPPKNPIKNPQLADHLLTTFEGAFIPAKIMNGSKLASEQLIQCRNHVELLLTQHP